MAARDSLGRFVKGNAGHTVPHSEETKLKSGVNTKRMWGEVRNKSKCLFRVSSYIFIYLLSWFEI